MRLTCATFGTRRCTLRRTPRPAMSLVRTNITLPAETLAIIDEVAGPRGRSAYIAEVLLRQAKRDRMKKVWRENFGVLKGSTTWGLSLIHISEPTRLGMISYAVFC